MNKKIFLTLTAALFFLTASYGQQSSQSNMKTLVRALAAQIPEINGTIGEPDELGENYFRCNMEDQEGGSATLQMYRYKRPAAATDWVLVAYDIHDFPIAAWLKCFTLDRKSGALAEVELPFRLLHPSQFDKEEFGEDHGYWRTGYTIFDNGNVLIDASPGMSYHCVMIARWDGKGSFRLFRRAGYDYMNDEVGADNAETEKYVQNVVRPNFQRINAIKKWEYIEKKENFDLSLEGATLTYYYSENGLEKIVAKLLGETFGSTIEYYFLDGRLSFIYDATTRYGIPPMHREALLSEGYKDIPDTKIERRWYLKGYNCIRGIGDNGKKLTPQQIEDEFINGDKGAYSFYTKIIEL